MTSPGTLLALALDTADLEQAVGWATVLGPHVDVMKVGLQLFVSAGPVAVEKVRAASGLDVFLDAKLDDIPNTVAGAARAAAAMGVGWLTVHTGAGAAACAAAAEATAGSTTRLLGVTLLTSLEGRDLKTLGMAADLGGVVDKRARLAAAAGLEGVVCAGPDQPIVAAAAPALLRVIPGVRMEGSPAGDQSRVGTPAEAARDGAAMIVVGRPITTAADPVAAAVAIRAQL